MSTHIHFATKERDDGSTYVTLRDDRPQWLADAVHDAHDDEMPNDWRYATCADICEMIDDGTEDACEIADALTDVYTGDLLEWANGHMNRACRPIPVEYLPSDEVDAARVLTLTQYETVREMAEILAAAIEENGAG